MVESTWIEIICNRKLMTKVRSIAWNTWIQISLQNLILSEEKKHVTCEEITCIISLITLRAQLHPEKDLPKPTCWPLLRRFLVNAGLYWRYTNKYSNPILDALFLRHAINRRSPSEVFLGKSVLKICSKLRGEHPCRSAMSMKLLYWNFISTRVSSCKFYVSFKNTFS